MAVTGFAGLVAAFRGRQRRWNELELYALRFLLLTSIGACLLALLPLVLLAGSREWLLVWQICQLLLGGWLIFLFIWTQRELHVKSIRPRRPIVNAGMWALGIGAAILNFAAVFGLTGPVIPGVAYLLGLLWLLLAAILQFVIQIMSSLNVGDDG